MTEEKDAREVMRIALTEIAKLREIVRDDKEAKMQMYKDFEIANEGLFMVMRDKQGELATMEDGLRAVALEEYHKKGDKNLEGGVKIRIAKTYEYNPEAALVWAKKHDMALQLDRKAFETIAKGTDIGCVEVVEVPKATIPVKILIEDG